MTRDALTGSRIRERRVMAGQKQADLAKRIGISASYLNLIEHNRRRIGGKLLLNIAAALGVEPTALTEGAEAALIATLREAADDARLSGPEATRADEFAGRFPGWADVLATAQRRIATLERTVETLTDRLAHDPHLAASMHELLTTAAAIRSTASILADTKTLEPEWRDRFHINIDQDSRRLADSAQALVGYLEADPEITPAADSPQEEVEAFLAAHRYRFATLEVTEGDADAIEKLIQTAPELQSVAARHIARDVLQQIAIDAEALPITRLTQALDRLGPDPVALGAELRQPVARVLRRLATVPELGAGLVICDRSGTLIFRKSIDGFVVPRFGACCPLWPLFAVLGSPGMVQKQRVAQLGRGHSAFDCFATCETQNVRDYNAVPLLHSVMLILPAGPDSAPALDVGATCRVCPRAACPARREPSILNDGV
ncbi:helix-turn-helix domain-containing protein [Sulfitobacter sp. M39]|uniref:helix-turn-helix transcriptional regulator n=1 Tax=Sulfitobacter sp. M39 TaxID=2675334 RepID=UPI001F340071|nr:helix-turn-helix transcriptional regulator [Sulfitobacter sp. M39]MCF7747571.1 helix-turn-helix domain-containing protein [Sulfitobacter sp. M39]